MVQQELQPRDDFSKINIGGSIIYSMSAASTSMGYSAFSDKDLEKCTKQDTMEHHNLGLFKQGILREDAIELSLQMMNSQGPG